MSSNKVEAAAAPATPIFQVTKKSRYREVCIYTTNVTAATKEEALAFAREDGPDVHWAEVDEPEMTSLGQTYTAKLLK
jgi:hypothetical protein